MVKFAFIFQSLICGLPLQVTVAVAVSGMAFTDASWQMRIAVLDLHYSLF